MVIRYIRHFDAKGNETREPYSVSDEELTEEAEVRDILTKADSLIDKDPKAFMKRIVRRLIKKGILP